MKAIAPIAAVLGIALLGASLIWAIVFPASRSWSTEQNDRMSELQVQAHKLGGELDAAQRRPSMHGRSTAEIEAEYKAVTEELSQLKEQFNSKRERPALMASILRWTGIGCVAVGAFVMFANRG